MSPRDRSEIPAPVLADARTATVESLFTLHEAGLRPHEAIALVNELHAQEMAWLTERDPGLSRAIAAPARRMIDEAAAVFVEYLKIVRPRLRPIPH